MARTTATADRTQTNQAPRQAPRDNLPAQQQSQQKPPNPLVQFREYVQDRMATLEDALPPTITPKRFVSVVMTALQNKPSLLACTFPSLWNACIRAAQDGLLPDGREGAIAPYGENSGGKRVAEIATWMPMVEGYRKKVFEAGHVHSWEVNVVYEKDEFDYELGDNAFIRHKPYIGGEASGGIVGAYSRAKLANGEVVREVMSAYQIMQVKAKSKAGNGPWQDQAFFPEMCKKVVARRHYKQLPHSESMDAMIARDDEEHGLLDTADTPPIARPERRRLSPMATMDAYAGETIDNETGEVTEMRGAATADQMQDRVERNGTVIKDRDAGTTGSAASETRTEAAGSAASSNSSASPASATNGASKEAAASGGASAAASNNTSGTDASPGAAGEADASGSQSGDATASGASASTSQDDSMSEDDAVDGADRPWPPGTEPTNLAEYERYLRTKLASFTAAGEVAPWWNSQAEKDLRVRCNAVADFKRLQDIAIERRKELP